MKPKKELENHLFNKLETYQSIDVEADWKETKGRMGFEKRRSLKPFLQIAATVALIVAMGFVAQKFLFSSPEMIIAQAGTQVKKVLLPDGSSVTLNKYSELSYPEKFSRKLRSLQLSGDAFFEVVKNPDKPFLLEVNHQALVRVLGTSFNISPHENDESITVQVIEGKVAFSSSPQILDEVILEKDQQATLTAGHIIRDVTLEENLMSWRTGRLVFYQTNITEVVRQLKAHYEINIILHNSVSKELAFTSTVEKQDLNNVLDEIAMVLGLSYSYENETVVFKNPE